MIKEIIRAIKEIVWNWIAVVFLIVDGLVVERKCHFDKEHFYRFEGDVSDLRLQEEEIQRVQWMSLEDIAAEIAAHPEEWTHESDELERLAVFLRELIINQHSH